MFSSYELEVILWYHSRVADWDGMGAPIWPSIRDRFIELGLLRASTTEDDGYFANAYRPTEKLHAYVHGLCNLPLPEVRYVIPPYNAPVEIAEKQS